MDETTNFLSLKVQLADLGFIEPHIADQSREVIYNDNHFDTLYTERGHTQFQINLEKDYLGSFQIETYEGVITAAGEWREQIFYSDVPVSDALQLLQNRLTRPDVNTAVAGAPMKREGVRVALGLSTNVSLNTNINQLNLYIMNTQNAEFLKKSLLNLGFGEKLNAQLDKEMAAKTPEFTLASQHEFNQKKVDYNLHFKAGDNQEMYFFNKYDATINHKDDPAKNVDQTFYINKGSGITAKEAFNLMEGRAVHKQLYNLEGQKYQAWVTLDDHNLTDNGNKKLKHYHENYGYDLEKVITGKGIKELENPKTKEDLMYSLKKGNAQQITVAGADGDKKYFITANPQFKTVDLFDGQQKKIKREELLQNGQAPAKSLKQSEQQKEDAPAKKQSRKNKMSV